MPAAIIGRKIGMTRFFKEDGSNIPVTVIQAGPCAVTQVKTEETDGYAAVQLAFNGLVGTECDRRLLSERNRHRRE